MGIIADKINTAMRDFVRFTGDGKPGAPVGKPLPVGDPASGEWNPPKKQVREAFTSLADVADGLNPVPAAESARDEAEGYADSAETDSASATQAKNAAEDAQLGAEDARDAASLVASTKGAYRASTIVAAIALGVADLAVDDTFTAAANDVDYIGLYIIEAGPVAKEIAKYPTSQSVFDLVAVTSADAYYIGAKKVIGGFKDPNGRFPLAIFEDGSVDIYSLDGTTTSSLNSAVLCYGDSLTSNGLALALATESGRTVTNNGIGGQVSQQIAARQGGLVQDVTISGNQITSGSNTVTHFNNIAIASNVRDKSQPLSTASNTTTRTMAVIIAGVSGVLQRTASGGPPSTTETYIFTPSVGQTVPVTCPARSAMRVRNSDELSLVQVIWSGRNDKTSPGWASGDVEANVRAMVDRIIKSGNSKFVVMGVTNGQYASEYEGGLDYISLVDLNRTLTASYPDNFFDARRFLIDRGLATAGITPTSQDDIDIDNDTVPDSLRVDAIHINSQAYTVLAAAIYNFINTKGW